MAEIATLIGGPMDGYIQELDIVEAHDRCVNMVASVTTGGRCMIGGRGMTAKELDGKHGWSPATIAVYRETQDYDSGRIGFFFSHYETKTKRA